MRLSIGSVMKFLTVMLFAVITFSNSSRAQNVYSQVTAINGSTISLLAGEGANYGVDTMVLIIQMKGADIYEANDAGYGAVTGYNNAGAYVFGTILSMPGADDILVDADVSNFSTSGMVQVIKVITGDASGNYTQGAITPPAWDGYTGGVYAANLCGDFTLSGDI
ncbi:MAG: hypothetical protein HRT72_01620, partial [Flavobacteriales bacterium]|nr:hypothetical protein [Flavobacteriales bacterium]